MKKKILVLTTVMIMSIAMTGCGSETDVADTTTEATTEQTTEEVTEDKGKKTTEDATTEETTEKQTDSKTEDKKDNKSEASDKADSKTSASNNKSSAGNKKSTSNNKGSAGNTSNSGTVASTPSQSSTPSTPAPQPANQTTECQHNWVEQMKTVHHDAVYDWIVTQPSVIYHYYCRACGKWYYTSDGCSDGYSGSYVAQEEQGYYGIVKEAYDEQVGTGTYKCSKCGAVK